MQGRWLVGTLTIATFVGLPALEAQVQSPLVGVQLERGIAPMPDDGLPVIPFMDGWYENEDGTISVSVGYYNLNRDRTVEIPLGPDNFMEPKEFDGIQPTVFEIPATIEDDGGGGGGGRGGALPPRRERTRGAFTVNLPADYDGEVVWTLRSYGQINSVPLRKNHVAYQLNWPMAMGSEPPVLRFEPSGPSGRGPMGVRGGPIQASVGVPTTLTVLISDPSVRDKPLVEIAPRSGKVPPIHNAAWYKYQGPGQVTFDPQIQGLDAGLDSKAMASATFSEPGEYVLRVVVDSHGATDSSSGNQCCWTNGYLRVTVTP